MCLVWIIPPSSQHLASNTHLLPVPSPHCCSTHPSQQWLPCWGSGWPAGCPGWTEPQRPLAPTRAPAPGIVGISPRRCRDRGWSIRRAAGRGSVPRWCTAVHLSAGLNRSSTCGSLLCLREPGRHTQNIQQADNSHLNDVYKYCLTKIWFIFTDILSY